MKAAFERMLQRLPWRRQARANAPLPVRMSVALRGGAGSARLPAAHPGLDETLIWVIGALLLWGLVMVYSTTIAMPDLPRLANRTQWSFLWRQLLAASLGSAASILVLQTPMSFWEKSAGKLFILALFLLALVLVPHVGIVMNKARRWLPMGPLKFQPSEFAKLAVVFYAADYIRRKMDVQEKERHMGDVMRFLHAVAPMALAIAVVGALLLGEPDMGAFILIASVVMGILFLGGVNARMSLLMSIILAAVFALMIATSDNRRERVFAYLNTWELKYAMGKGYQLTQSLITLGRGEWFGVGLGGSVGKLHWLSDAHTDFMLAVIGEEFGFVGIVLLIALFFWLTRRIMQIGRRAIALDRTFSGLAVQGIGLWTGFQAFIHIGVNLGALPTKGLTLPLVSYGGSALMVHMVALAVVLRADYENRALMQGGVR